MKQAPEVWTGVMVGLGVLVFVIQPTYIGGMQPAPLPPWLPPVLVVFVLWYIGAIVLVVAAMVRAFRPADPRTTSGRGATAEGPPPEQPPPS